MKTNYKKLMDRKDTVRAQLLNDQDTDSLFGILLYLNDIPSKKN